MTSRVLIIGLDGGTWTVLKPAMEKGYLPFLKSLADDGISGILKSTIPSITPAAWGSFQTGKNPGKTGVFDFSYWDKHERKSHYVCSFDLGITLWDILSKNGKRIGVINVPMTYPPKEINGYLVSGLLTPSMQTNFTWPPDFKHQLLKEFPDYHIFDLKKISQYRSDKEDLELFLRHLVSVIQVRTRLARWILQKESLDLFMVHFQATDVLQHVYWHYLDNTHPLFEPSKQEVIFQEFYHKLDKNIKSVYDDFCQENGEPLTMVVSDHGFQSHQKRFNLGNWLTAEGYLKFHKNTGVSRFPILKKITRSLGLGKKLKRILPSGIIASMNKKLFSKSEPYDWDHSFAYSVGRSNEGFLYLLPEEINPNNPRLDELREKLSDIIDPETHRPVFKKIWLRDELYTGSQLEKLPDMVIEPSEGYSVTGYYQRNENLFHTIVPQADMHMGKHHPDGILVIAGRDIKSQTAFSSSILDITPTLLSYLGIPQTGDMDGTIQAHLFSENIQEAMSLSYDESQTVHSGQVIHKKYTKKEEKEIQQRLKDLGYL